MTRELTPIDIRQVPELDHLVDEVRTTRLTRRITRGNQDVALLVPVPPAADAQPQQTPAPQRFPKGGVVAATAGIVRYDGPALSIEQERAAFEQGVADEAME